MPESGDQLIKLTEDEINEWYAYRGNQKDGSSKLILAMEQRGWTFREQLGSGYFFRDSSERNTIAESQMWTGSYVLYKVHIMDQK